MISYSFNIPQSKLTFNKNITSRWIEEVIKEEGSLPGELLYTFCSDEQLLDINVKFLNHDTYTDIISFPASSNTGIISGEIFISTDRVIENASKFNSEPTKELFRVMIHGVLHFLGYEDHSDQEKRQMRAKEDYYIHLHPEIL